MKYSILSIYLVGFLFLTSNCRSQSKDVNINFSGIWVYIDESNSYSEFKFSDHILTINSDSEGQLGPYDYILNGDSLYYSDCKYEIIKHGCDSISLISSEFGKLELEKINLANQKEEINSYNPFYLRRCFYLVNRGEMRMSDALKYLNSLWPVDSIQDEIIYSSPKH